MAQKTIGEKEEETRGTIAGTKASWAWWEGFRKGQAQVTEKTWKGANA